ncbi:hypothetical protein [Denitrobaculum tricleocarpae]|uniref:Uncharacterized protein n=1 Tax=Denitrobaculum tricleocarpae TaxID=2591009 RepID=A0A545TB68_9PROT|nr:hypothetical protein [Denitrobaculum tricleocarpae]TQV74459.1 hypothetical protein FKG95_24590 [Denitrobaculum tricleocarpae]
MNAPDISIKSKISSESRSEAAKPETRAGNRSGDGLDDVAALFPGMEISHDLRISGQGDAQLLCSVSPLLKGKGAKIITLSLRSGNAGQTSIKCRLSGLTSRAARELVADLLHRAEVTSAQVEHVILKAG